MQFKILSREKVEKLIDFPQKTIIISIRDIDAKPVNFIKHKNLIAVLPIEFNDEESVLNQGMSEQQAEEIIKFLNNYINEADLCIVHCSAGISRSAGVCAALMKIVNNDDSEVFNNPKYCPNRNCYSTILRKYYGVYDLKEIEEKFKHNIEIWREANKEFLDNETV